MNEELSTDDLKDVAGGKGSYTKCATGEHIDKLVQIESWSLKDKTGKKGMKGKKGPEDNNYLTITMEE